MRKVGEVHTLRVEVSDPEKFSQVIDFYLSQETTPLGFKITGIATGDYFDYLEPKCDSCEVCFGSTPETALYSVLCDECKADGA